MKRWRLGLSKLSGLLAPGQEMVNHFTREMAKAEKKRPSFQPYVTPGLAQEPWRPFYPAHAKALGNWKVLNSSHKKPSQMDLSFQAWAFYNLRFLRAGELAGAWAPFGGISAQLTHIGLILNMAVIENATIDMTYADHFREQASHLARLRATTVDWAHPLSEEDDVIKRNVLRELGQASAEMKPTNNAPRDQTHRTEKTNNKNGKGAKTRKGDKQTNKEG